MSKVWWCVPLLLAACGGSNPANMSETAATGPGPSGNPPGASPASSKRLICPQCTENAGGETSDFGDNSSALQLGGDAIYAAPTACEQSERRSRIDEAGARALGFGAVLDRLATSFDRPLEWTPKDPAATGYAVQTRLRGTTAVTAIEHVVPTLAGCVDSLHVGVATTLETADGALSIAGQVGTRVLRDSEVLELYGLLDLSTARGSLEIFPPPTELEVAGYVTPVLYLWPEEVRVDLGVSVFALQDIGSDTPEYSYDPLEGRAPVDACEGSSKPIAFEQSIVDTQGNSLAAAYPEIRSWVGASQPFAASWSSGEATSVSVELGEPFELCDLQRGGVSYQLPFRLQSSDGRIAVQHNARAYLAFENGHWRDGWMEVFPAYDDGPGASGIEDPATFALHTGISGVDFGEVGGGRWYTELKFGHAGAPVSGELTVEGIDTDGHLTGIKNVILPDPVARLLW